MFELKTSPIFNLSMASKELFHSNMLYWVSTTYPLQFTAILEIMGVETQYWPSNWTSHREKNYFDLVITDAQEKTYLFVLENKVKSIPYTEQLNNYKDKVKDNCTQWMLLSLATDLPSEESIRKQNWNIKNYQDLAIAIYKVLPSIDNNYHRLILEDYCQCILLLHNKQLSWRYEGDKSYLEQFVNSSNFEEEKSLRIDDVKKKVLFSRLAAELQEKLKAKLFTNKEIICAQKNSQSGDVYINYGMTHATGLIDIKIRIEGNLLFVIQVQGDAYKHCIETLDTDDKSINTLKSVGLLLEKKEAKTTLPNSINDILNRFFFIIDEERVFDRFPLSEKNAKFPNSKKGGKTSAAYNKYGKTFIYQYVKIAEATVNEVVAAIFKDVENVSSCIKSKTVNI